jgi:hypothetical protein
LWTVLALPELQRMLSLILRSFRHDRLLLIMSCSLPNGCLLWVRSGDESGPQSLTASMNPRLNPLLQDQRIAIHDTTHL